MAASPRKHATLVAATDTSLLVTGRGFFMVQNHVTATNDLLWVNPISGVAPVAAADDMICIDPGGFRIIDFGDNDGTVDIHVLSASTIFVSAEHYQPIQGGD